MNEELNKALEALEAKLKGANAEEVKALQSDIAELRKELEKGDTVAVKEFNELKEQFEEQVLIIKELQSKGTTEEQKGTLLKAFEEKIKEQKPSENKYHQFTQVIKAAALMTTANVIPNATDGFNQLFGNYIVSGIGSAPKPALAMMDLINITTQPGTEKIWYVDRINEEGDAEFIAEGALKPLADAEYKEFTAEIKEVALRWKQSKRLLNHAPSAVTDFRMHANELMEQKLDDKLINGDEATTPAEYDGANTVAGAFVVPSALANYYADANIFDAIMAVATQIRLANFNGQLTAVLNTQWKPAMIGIKGSDGHYVVPRFVSPDGTVVGDVKVVFRNKQDAGVITVGDMSKFNMVIAENITYDEGYENDDFSKNLVSKKLEAFAGTYFRNSDAGSIISDDIATVLTAIETIA